MVAGEHSKVQLYVAEGRLIFALPVRANTRRQILRVRNLLLIASLGIITFLLLRNQGELEGEHDKKPQVAQASLPASTAPKPAPTPVRNEAATLDTDAVKIRSVGGDFPVRVAVDRMADAWERHRHDVDYPAAGTRRLGKDQFGIIIRKMQQAEVYAEDALERVVSRALEIERASASPSQREIIRQGIFQMMRDDGGVGAN